MKKFRQSLIDNVIDPNTKVKITNAKGQISRYDKINNLADVCLHVASIGQKQILTNVPVQISSIGIHSASLKEGDYVYIQFNNNSIFQPKIMGKCDELYATHTREDENHIKQGYLKVSQEKIDEDVTASSENWIESRNTNKTKYLKYKDTNPLEDMSNKINSQGYFKGQEVGVYNPASSSIMKIQDDGSIDIFMESNIGIRINANNKTIEILGDQTTKSKNWSVLSNNVDIIANERIHVKTKEIVIEVDKIIKNGESIDV